MAAAVAALTIVIDLAVASIAAYLLVFRAPIGSQGEGRRTGVALVLGTAATAVWLVVSAVPGLALPGGGMPPAALVFAGIRYFMRAALWAVVVWPLSMFLLERRLGVRLDAATALCAQMWVPAVIVFVIIDALAALLSSVMRGG